MFRYQPANSGQRRAQDNPQYPKGFTPIRSLLDGTVTSGALVNIVGVVKDYRLPISTKGLGESAFHLLIGWPSGIH